MNFCFECGTSARDCCCGALTPDTSIMATEAREAAAGPPVAMTRAEYAACREIQRLAGLRGLAKREAVR